MNSEGKRIACASPEIDVTSDDRTAIQWTGGPMPDVTGPGYVFPVGTTPGYYPMRATATYTPDGGTALTASAFEGITIGGAAGTTGSALAGGFAVEFVTKGPNGELWPQDFTFNCVPCPQITITASGTRLSPDGASTVISISGTVTDPASDLVNLPSKQLQVLDLFNGSQILGSVSLVNADTPQLPWRPYAFKANFTVTGTLPNELAGGAILALRTSQNVAGCAATLDVYLNYDLPPALDFGPAMRSTFLPSLVRINAQSNALGSNATLYTFGRTWQLKSFDFGDGPQMYAVDDQGKAVVFLPAAYAQTYIQTQLLWDPWLVLVDDGKGGKKTQSLKVAHGLLVNVDNGDGAATDAIVASAITANTYDTHTDGTIWVHKVRWYEPKAQGATPANQWVRSEIIWRYVCTPKTVVSFSSNEQLNNDISYRLNVVSYVRTFKVGWGPGKTYALNGDFWDKSMGPFVYRGNSAGPPLADLWNTPTKYALGCAAAALFITSRAAATTSNDLLLTMDRLGQQVHNDLRRVMDDALQEEYYLPPEYWIPGDWGRINNPTNPDQLLCGRENVIYLGSGPGAGCFDLDEQFQANGQFWGFDGDGGTIASLNAWKSKVGNFPGTPPGPQSAVVDGYRVSLRQPVGKVK